MLDVQLILFPYRTKGGVLETKDCTLVLDIEHLKIIGQVRRIVYDPVKIRPVYMTGLFIQYENIEYGSLSMTLDQLMAEVLACNCGELDFRIHSIEHALEFN